MLDFTWDAEKAETNVKKHHIGFDVAALAFLDPHCMSEIERVVDGEVRWQTIGMVEGRVLLLVAHTVTIEDEEEGEPLGLIRIISSREATRKERRRYEENR